MFKQTLTYDDYNGIQHTKDFYFNLNEAELTEMEVTRKGGLSVYLKTIIETEDNKIMLELFKEIVTMSFGEKSEDGSRFVKSPELLAGFMQTEAYPQFFMKLFTGDDFASDFINGIMPKGLLAKIQAEAALKKKTPDMSPSELARARSQASLQGYKQPAPVEVVETAAPVLAPSTEKAPDTSRPMSPDELVAAGYPRDYHEARAAGQPEDYHLTRRESIDLDRVQQQNGPPVPPTPEQYAAANEAARLRNQQ